MKKFVLIFLIGLLSLPVFSQEKKFIFFQSEKRQPFYVAINGKTYSSTNAGYVIIPQLKSAHYTFSIGFTKQDQPEQTFDYDLKDDVGFSLKNFGESGWGLFNFQTMAVTKASGIKSLETAKEIPLVEMDEPISFTAKKDTAEVEPVEVTGASVSQAAVTNPEHTALENKSVQISSSTADSLNNFTNKHHANTTDNLDVSKISEKQNRDGISIVYTDKSGKNPDTINVVVPVEATAESTKASSANSFAEDLSAKKSTVDTEASSAKENIKFLDLSLDTTTIEAAANEKGSITQAVKVTNQACDNVASDDDYTRLRRKMAKETTDDDMMEEAHKMYRKKCFSTDHIRSLSTLFLSDEGRFKFFKDSYPFVSDPSNYNDLKKEFIDPTFASRFKLMLNN